VALIAADGAAVVTYTERFWRTLAGRPSDAAPDDSAAAAVIEMLFRQGLLQQPISIDDLAEGASWNGLARRALLVVRIEGTSRQPVRLVWYATRPATLSPYADVAEAFAHHAGWALETVTECDNLNQGRSLTASGRTGPRNLDDPPWAYGRAGIHPAATPVAEHPREATNDRSNRHPDRRSAGLPRRLRPMTPPQLSAKPGEDPQAPSSVVPPRGRRTRAQRRLARRLTAFAFVAGSGLQGTSHLRFRNPT
jgi:hypothetical protein